MRSAAFAPALIALLTLAAPAGASVFTVTKTADTLDGACDPYDCSLREAVVAANQAGGTDVIELPPGTYVLTRTGEREDNAATGDLDVKDQLILVGRDASTTILDGNAADRVLDISAQTEIFGVTVRNGRSGEGGGGIRIQRKVFNYPVVIRRSIISGNYAAGSGGDGGGVLSEGYGPLVVLESTVSGNRADAKGGAIAAEWFGLIDSTVSGNSAGQFGGGLFYRDNASPPIWGSTITGNQAGREGGGIYVETLPWPTVEGDGFMGSIVAGNTAPAGPDCIRAYSSGYNVIGIADGCGNSSNLDRTGSETAPLDPKLGPLASQGGPTPVHALLPGSPALDLVPAEACTTYDQLGQARSVSCEAGAVEQPLQPACVPGGQVLCLKNGRFKVTASWASPDGSAGPATAAPLTDDTGNYWFFSPQNLELTVKILDGCGLNDRWWVFTSGLTDRGVNLRVEDLYSGQVWTHEHLPRETYGPRLDTSALDACHTSGGPAKPGAPGEMAIGPVSSVLVVTTGTDTFHGGCDHDCSLREAVVASNDRDGSEVILLGPRIHTLTRAGRDEDAALTGDLDVDDPLVILGSGARQTVIDGGGIDRILQVRDFGKPLEIHGVTLRNGTARMSGQDPHGYGGAIDAQNLILVASHITGNRAEHGGGLKISYLVARDTTVSNNEARYIGGGIDAGYSLLSNVTVSGNRAGYYGGGLAVSDGEIDGLTVTGNSAGEQGGGFWIEGPDACPSNGFPCYAQGSIRGSIVAGNVAPVNRDCLGFETVQSSYNVFGVDEASGCAAEATDLAGTPASPLDPRLSPLGDHGGPTPTHALLADSPAIDLGDLGPAAGCLPVDQRGRLRPSGNGCDAGAFERHPGCQPDETTLCLGAGDRFRVTAHWTAKGESGDARSIPLATDTGSFWFFNPANVELTLKVLDGCAVNDRFWVFVSGLTDVRVDVTVEDTRTGRTWTYSNPADTPFQPRLDTKALDVCSEGS